MAVCTPLRLQRYRMGEKLDLLSLGNEFPGYKYDVTESDTLLPTQACQTNFLQVCTETVGGSVA